MTILPISWIVGVLVGGLGLLGLTMAAHAVDTGAHLFGMLLFAFAILFDFWLIKRSFDLSERGQSI